MKVLSFVILFSVICFANADRSFYWGVGATYGHFDDGRYYEYDIMADPSQNVDLSFVSRWYINSFVSVQMEFGLSYRFSSDMIVEGECGSGFSCSNMELMGERGVLVERKEISYRDWNIDLPLSIRFGAPVGVVFPYMSVTVDIMKNIYETLSTHSYMEARTRSGETINNEFFIDESEESFYSRSRSEEYSAFTHIGRTWDFPTWLGIGVDVYRQFGIEFQGMIGLIPSYFATHPMETGSWRVKLNYMW